MENKFPQISQLSVSFGAVAGGITAGVFTAYLMVFNNLSIGAIATLVGQNHLLIVADMYD